MAGSRLTFPLDQAMNAQPFLYLVRQGSHFSYGVLVVDNDAMTGFKRLRESISCKLRYTLTESQLK